MIGGRPYIAAIVLYSIAAVHGNTIFGIFGLCSYTADMTTDLIVAWELFARGEVLYGMLTLGFVYFPMLLAIAVYNDWITCVSKCTGWSLRRSLILLWPVYLIGSPIAPIIIMVKGIAATCRGQMPPRMVGQNKLAEPVFESFPQTLLQTMIILKALPEYKASQVVSIVVSLFAMGFAISTNTNFENAATSSKVTYFCVVPLSVATKAVICSMLAIVNTYWFLFVIFAEWFIYFIIIFTIRMYITCNLMVPHLPCGKDEGQCRSGTQGNFLPQSEENHVNLNTNSGSSESSSDCILHDFQDQCNSTIVCTSNGSILIRVPLDVATQCNPTIVSLSGGFTIIHVDHDEVMQTNCDADTAYSGSNNSHRLPHYADAQNNSDADSIFSAASSSHELHAYTNTLGNLNNAYDTSLVSAPFDSFTRTGIVISFLNLTLSLVGLFIAVPLPVVITAIMLASSNLIINGILVMIPQFRYIGDDWQCIVSNWVATPKEWKKGWNAT